MDKTAHRVTLTFARPEGIGLYAAEDILALWLAAHPEVEPVMGWDPATRTATVTLGLEAQKHDGAVGLATEYWREAWVASGRPAEGCPTVVGSSAVPTSLDR